MRDAGVADGVGACDDPATLEIAVESSRLLSEDEVSQVKQAFSAVEVQEYEVPVTPLCGEMSFQGVAWDSFAYALPADCANTRGLAPVALERFAVIEEMILGLRTD